MYACYVTMKTKEWQFLRHKLLEALKGEVSIFGVIQCDKEESMWYSWSIPMDNCQIK